MTADSTARRYAAVLFDLTQARGITDRALADLRTLQSVIADHEQLRAVFETPLVSPQKKRQIVEGLFAASSDVTDEVRRLMLLLAERDRLALLPGLTAAFHARQMRFKNIQSAEVVTAVPLGTDDRAALARALSKAVGSEVTMHERVDPAIIGGVIARVGSIVFDGSVTRQMERLREQLTAES